MCLSSSASRCDTVPLPCEAMFRLAGLLPRQLNQLRHRLHWQVDVHQQDMRNIGDQRYRNEILDQVVVEFRIQRGRNGVYGSRPHQQRVAVGWCMRRKRCAQIGAGTGTIVDDHRLAELLAEPLAHQAPQQISGASRRERHDHAHRMVRILGPRRRKHDTEQCHRHPSCQPPHQYLPVSYQGSSARLNHGYSEADIMPQSRRTVA